MSRIRIQNFGPIRGGYREKGGWMDIEKVTVFTGNQGSGKSTVAKLISTFTWMEKALVRGDYPKKWFERKNKLKNQFLNYHRLEDYFSPHDEKKTVIQYEGDAFSIDFRDGVLNIYETRNGDYPLPQILYVPAERNFLAYIKTPKELKLTSPALQEFLAEYGKALDNLKKEIELPINNTRVEYDRLNKLVKLKGEGYKLKLIDASSGFQSLVPLYMVAKYLAESVKKQSQISKESMSTEERVRFKEGFEEIWNNENLTDEQKRIALSVLSSKFNKTSFINIVEEPEQNLFPSSQQKLLYSLLEFNNMNSKNKLVMTTHSPYLINYLTLAVKADNLLSNIRDSNLIGKISEIVPVDSTIKPKDLAIYELNEKDGSINKLDEYHGLPSDENELNESLAESNELFARLLEIQQFQ